MLRTLEQLSLIFFSKVKNIWASDRFWWFWKKRIDEYNHIQWITFLSSILYFYWQLLTKSIKLWHFYWLGQNQWNNWPLLCQFSRIWISVTILKISAIFTGNDTSYQTNTVIFLIFGSSIWGMFQVLCKRGFHSGISATPPTCRSKWVVINTLLFRLRHSVILPPLFIFWF